MEQRDAEDAYSRRSREPMRLRHVSSAERGTEKPISGGSKVFVPGILGQLSHEDARDVKIQQARGRIRKRH
ncbi:hypothetical protein KI387_040312, partial [Taxus chinensis]